MSATTIVTDKFRWDRLTYSSALGYALLVGALSVGAVLGELREQFDLSGVIAALHGSTFGFASLAAGIWGVRVVDRLGRRQSLLFSAVAIACGITMFCLGPAWPVTLAGTALGGMGGALLTMVMPGVDQRSPRRAPRHCVRSRQRRARVCPVSRSASSSARRWRCSGRGVRRT